jgi:hypothetical protein
VHIGVLAHDLAGLVLLEVVEGMAVVGDLQRPVSAVGRDEQAGLPAASSTGCRPRNESRVDLMNESPLVVVTGESDDAARVRFDSAPS